MYHVELREFPHNTHAYNLDAGRLRATVLDFFVRGEIFELGGQQWIPARTKMTILEGDELPLHALSMNRGWNAARRKGKDVTAELLAEAQAAVRTAPAATVPADRDGAVAGDILARCAMGPISLAAVWDRAEIAAPQASSGDWLVLAQKAVTQLLKEDRVVLRRGEESDAPVIAADEVEAVLRTREAWASDRATSLFVHAA